MPELPEVETLRRQLNHTIPGKSIKFIQILKDKSFRGNKSQLINLEISKIDRIAKLMKFRFKNRQFPQLLCHLRMTGQLIFQPKMHEKIPFAKRDRQFTRRMPGEAARGFKKAQNLQEAQRNKLTNLMITSNFKPKKYKLKANRIVGGHPTPDWVNELPSKHTRVIITFSDNSIIYFNDQRIFGYLQVVNTPIELDQATKNFTGVEPLQSEFTVKELALRMQKTAQPIKTAILDQKKIAGMGNIYANDALWDAKIHPSLPANKLTNKQYIELHTSIEKVIALGIKYGGATESDYRHLDGLGGSYQNYFLAYNQKDKPCQRCKTRIKKMKVGGRGTFFCPKCQKE